VAAILVAWGISAALLILLAVVLGTITRPPSVPFGIFIDNRGRFSLTHFQLVLWSLVILSLISGIFWGRLVEGVQDPLGFTIPGNVLGLLGISVGSAVTAGVVKASKDASATSASRIAASNPAVDPPRWGQIFLLEEGEYADSVVDVTKFQNFVITLVLVVAYVALSIDAIVDAKQAVNVTTLPDIAGTFVILLGISHAGYVAGKVPNQAGRAPGLNMSDRQTVLSAAAAGASPPDFKPRNPRPPT
jgi:hypothetical protein